MKSDFIKIGVFTLSCAMLACEDSTSPAGKGGSAAGNIDVCALVTYADMEAAMGIAPLEHEASKGNPAGKACQWMNFESGGGYFISSVGIATSAEFREVYNSEVYDGAWLLGQLKDNDSLDYSITEIGDDGVFYGGSLDQLYLLKEPYFLTIVLDVSPKMEDDDAIVKERSLALAKKILDRLD